MNFRKHWWKIAGVLIMLYVMIAGILIPLKPGIVDYSNGIAYVNQSYELVLSTYNSHFDQANDVNAYILLPDDRLLRAKSTQVINAASVKAAFDIPNEVLASNMERMESSIVLDNEIDGYMQYPDAVTIKQSESAQGQLKAEFASISDLHNNQDFKFPFRPIIYETVRNTFFHVAIWMSMFLILIISCYHSIRYLLNKDLVHDTKSSALTTTALIFGIAGLLTGSMWARFTWGTWWTNDIKLNMTSIALLIYCSYWILRSSISDIDTRARLCAVFNLFSFVALFVLVMVIPRLTDSLHPGNGGNPAFGDEDLDNTLRAVFYPAIIGYTIIGLWISQLTVRYYNVKDNFDLLMYNNSN